jgi:hypothetical protein
MIRSREKIIGYDVHYFPPLPNYIPKSIELRNFVYGYLSNELTYYTYPDVIILDLSDESDLEYYEFLHEGFFPYGMGEYKITHNQIKYIVVVINND